MFAHRLGLIPINLDPRKLEWRQGGKFARCIRCMPHSACSLIIMYRNRGTHLQQFWLADAVESSAADTPGTERNTVVFKLHIDCTRNADGTMTNDKGGALACTVCCPGLMRVPIIALFFASPGSCCERLRCQTLSM